MAASYQYVLWQPDDEVVSSKLKQMADNEQTLFDNSLVGDLTYSANGSQLPFGRQLGTEQAKRMQGIYIPFNSQVPVSSILVDVPYPPVFTFAPIVTFSIAQGSGAELCGVLTVDAITTKCTVKIFRRDGAAVVLAGALNVICIGR